MFPVPISPSFSRFHVVKWNKIESTICIVRVECLNLNAIPVHNARWKPQNVAAELFLLLNKVTMMDNRRRQVGVTRYTYIVLVCLQEGKKRACAHSYCQWSSWCGAQIVSSHQLSSSVPSKYSLSAEPHWRICMISSLSIGSVFLVSRGASQASLTRYGESSGRALLKGLRIRNCSLHCGAGYCMGQVLWLQVGARNIGSC